jgi:hypothetical protein
MLLEGVEIGIAMTAMMTAAADRAISEGALSIKSALAMICASALIRRAANSRRLGRMAFKSGSRKAG